LVEFVRALPEMTIASLPDDRADRVLDLAESLRSVDWELPEQVREVNFHVFGVRGAPRTADFSGYRYLIVSPFVNDTGLYHVAPNESADVTLVSRAEELDKLDPASLKGISTRVISALAGLEEPDQSNSYGGARDLLGGLHAKLFVIERSKLAHLFVGSANATDAAFSGNVEFLVELVGGATKLGIDEFLGDDAPFASMLETYSPMGGADPGPDEDPIRILEEVLRDLAERSFTLTVQPDSDLFRIEAATNEAIRLPVDVGATMELLTRPGEAAMLVDGKPASASFTRVALADITPFLVLRASLDTGLGEISRATVVRAELRNDPPGRLDEVLARQVDTPEKFLHFLTLLLGLGTTIVSPPGGEGGAGGGWGRAMGRSGILELLLRALAERPASLVELDRLVSRLLLTNKGKTVLPHGFEELWSEMQLARARMDGFEQEQ